VKKMEEKVGRLDPWGSDLIKDYKGVMDEFGIQGFKPLLKKIKSPHLYMRRGIIFGHRDFDKYLDAVKKGEPYALLTGMMPTGSLHFGSKMVADEVVWFQNMGAEIFFLIADLEAFTVREISLEQGRKNAVDMLLSMIALGLKPEKCHIYFQSDYKPPYYKLQNMFSRRVTLNEFKALYGNEVTPAKMMSALIQSADILHPQLKEFGGFKNVVVPVGIDQDVHIRLTRDLAARTREFSLRPPSSIYHRFQEGLDGGKMSKSRPDSVISLTDSPKEAVRKLRNALDGGRETAADQKELGGQPDKCMVFNMLMYHLVGDDKTLANWEQECRGGMLCGDCKKRACALMEAFVKDHHKKREEARKLLPKFGIKA
jgi:tryptophanyl-tRNA synthetase